MSDPLRILSEILDYALKATSAGTHPRERVKIRYGKGMMNELAHYLIHTYYSP